jgi:hypothetical protein
VILREEDQPDTLKQLALTQRANGSFLDAIDQHIILKDTVKAILTFLQSEKDITIYKKQIQKAFEFLIGGIINTKGSVEESDTILILSAIAFIFIRDKGIIRDKKSLANYDGVLIRRIEENPSNNKVKEVLIRELTNGLNYNLNTITDIMESYLQSI